MRTVDEFKTRHTTITHSINDTYRIGNKLLDYVEKQVIIDFHLRGEQAKMEEKYPKLVKKAQKFLGMQAYFDLSVSQIKGMEMSSEDPYYSMLMKKQDAIQSMIAKDYEAHVSTRENDPNLPNYDKDTVSKNDEIEAEKEAADAKNKEKIKEQTA